MEEIRVDRGCRGRLAHRGVRVATIDSNPSPATLAILPFKSVSPTDEDASLRFGMTDTLISRLRELDGVNVQPLGSVRRYGKPDQDAMSAARELGVASVLDGTIQRSGDRLRVTARLFNVTDGRQLWSQSFDERFTDIFGVQDAIAARVTEALAIRLTGQAEKRLKRRYTEDAEAYQLYVKGWFQRSKVGEEGFREVHRILQPGHRARSQLPAALCRAR